MIKLQVFIYKNILESFHLLWYISGMNFGQRIRSLRKENGLSLEQLSSKSGVALATLSRIENGKGSGTFRTHQRIAEALRIPLTEMYKDIEESEPDTLSIESGSEEAETFMYDEKASAILLAKQVSTKQMLPQLIVLQEGGKTSVEQYPAGTERWLFVLEGTVEVSVAGKIHPLTTGNTLYFKGSLAHQLTNVGDVVAKIVSVTSPVVL